MGRLIRILCKKIWLDKQIAEELGVTSNTASGLEEFDRPVLPIMSTEEHSHLNKPIFEDPDKLTIGNESGSAALLRFEKAINGEKELVPSERNLVIVSHGTVISLFVQKHNELNGFDLWKKLTCPSFVELGLSRFQVVRIVENPIGKNGNA